MNLDVVVVNYRTPEDLRQFVASYRTCATTTTSLTVVDVDPIDPGLVWDFKGFEPDAYLTVRENCGYGGACNLGASLGSTGAEAILLANADTLLEPVALWNTYTALMENKHYGVIGPRQVDQHNRITAGGVFGDPAYPQLRAWREPDRGQASDVRTDALTVSGALYMIKRSVWDELTTCPIYQEIHPGAQGAFLETPHYFEETACSYHARAHGYRCVFFGPAVMRHDWHKASEVGGWADQQFGLSRQMFRDFCTRHDIPCE